MIFYKFTAKLNDEFSDDGVNRAAEFADKGKRYNMDGKNTFCFISGEDDGTVSGCMIVMNERGESVENVSFPWEYFKLNVGEVSVREITSAALYNELQAAEDGRFFRASRYEGLLGSMRRSLGFDNGGIFSDEYFYSEGMAEPSSKEECQKFVRENLWEDALAEEFGRIYIPHSGRFLGHPVHYLLRSDNYDMREQVAKKLIAALWANGRLKSRRFCSISVSSLSLRDIRSLKELYSCCTGGTVMLRFRAGAGGRGFGDGSVDDIIANICSLVKQFKNSVLTIFCFPLNAEKEKSLFFENLSNFSVCEYSDAVVDAERAKNYLCGLAEKNGVAADGALFADILPGKTYRSSELGRMYDEWYGDMLKKTAYPEYFSVKRLGEKECGREIAGAAYAKLMSLTGLSEVKKVINQAVNYCRAGKIFAEMGMKFRRLPMHMAFLGNPGTAKTTVARLFAEIMRDNGVLSSGHIVEAGRGDLVGKYVGHTAPLVKSKFREAEGGVLFIDEAYSLVDEKQGSYGDEAINTIVQEMENRRDSVVVIFAGYTDRMREFIARNPGLKSRISFELNFDDYSVDELMDITRGIGSEYGVQFTGGALDKLRGIYAAQRGTPDFGNGRFVRTMIEKAMYAHADRLMSLGYGCVSEGDVSTITEADIPVCAGGAANIAIGFGE